MCGSKNCGPKNDLNVNSPHGGGTNASSNHHFKFIFCHRCGKFFNLWVRLCSYVAWSKLFLQTKSKLWCLDMAIICVFKVHSIWIIFHTWRISNRVLTEPGLQKRFFPTLAVNMLLEVTILIELFVTHAAFENTQGQKMSQIQSAWLYIWSANVFRAHLKIHSGEKLNKCNQCDSESSQEGNLWTHLKMHSEVKSN